MSIKRGGDTGEGEYRIEYDGDDRWVSAKVLREESRDSFEITLKSPGKERHYTLGGYQAYAGALQFLLANILHDALYEGEQ